MTGKGGVGVVLGPLGGSGFVDAIGSVEGVASVVAPGMDGVAAALADAEVLVSFRWSDEWIDTGLRWIQSVSAGTEHFPTGALREAGIVLTSAVGIHAVQVSEHAFGLLLAMTRGIAQAIRQQADRMWDWPKVVDLEGLTLGVLGLGTIGEAVAQKGRAFGMSVIGTKRTPSGYAGVADEVFPPEATYEVFARADAVIVTLPGTAETAGIVGARELQALAGGWLVNVGRGSVIDEAALIAAVEAETLAGVALDVFETEPLPAESPLWGLPGVIVSPHVAGNSPRYAERLARLFERNLRAYGGRADWVNRVV